MKRLLAALLLGIVIVTIPFSVLGEGLQTYYRSALDILGDAYITWGDTQHPKDSALDMTLVVDPSSANHMSVFLDFTINVQVINDRHITKFYIVANDRIIDAVNVQYYTDWDGSLKPKSYYHVAPTSWELTGTTAKFQVLAIEETMEPLSIPGSGTVDYVVAWTGKSQDVNIDPLDVKDQGAIDLLESILNKLDEILSKLEEMKNTLGEKLDQLNQEVASMFTPSEAAKQNMDNAMKELKDAMPFDKISQQGEQMKNMFDTTVLDEPESKYTLGEKRDWFGTGSEMYLFDFTDLQDQIKLIRSFLSAVVWIEFFMFLVAYIAPKLNL